MRRHAWARAALLLVTASTLSGCIWVPYGDERERGRGHGEGREGGYHEEHRGGDEGGRR